MEKIKTYVVEFGKMEAPINATSFGELFDSYDGYTPFNTYEFNDKASAVAFFEKIKNDLIMSAGASGKQLIDVAELYVIDDSGNVIDSMDIAFAKKS